MVTKLAENFQNQKSFHGFNHYFSDFHHDYYAWRIFKPILPYFTPQIYTPLHQGTNKTYHPPIFID